MTAQSATRPQIPFHGYDPPLEGAKSTISINPLNNSYSLIPDSASPRAATDARGLLCGDATSTTSRAPVVPARAATDARGSFISQAPAPHKKVHWDARDHIGGITPSTTSRALVAPKTATLDGNNKLRVFSFKRRQGNCEALQRALAIRKEIAYRPADIKSCTTTKLIIDSAASVSVVHDWNCLRADTVVIFDEGDQNHLDIEGITANANLSTLGAGQLSEPFSHVRALYSPDATANILSWWDVKRDYLIDIVRQDRPDEHLLLSHKRTGAKLKCFIDKEIGFYVYCLDTTKVMQESFPSRKAKAKILSISATKQLHLMGLPKQAASRAALVQELHESLAFAAPDIILDLIRKKGDKSITPADYNFWRDHYHPIACKCRAGKATAPAAHSSSSRMSDKPGEQLFIDLFYVTSPIPTGNETVLLSVDEASNNLTLECIETKGKKHLMDALYNIGDVYKKANFKVKKARTDGEPAFADRRKDIESFCGWEVSHCQPYCHNKPVERAVRTVRGKFGAIIHNSECPIPAFLYKYVLMHVADCCNRTFNVKNAGLVPYEQLHPDEQALDLDDIIKHKFGKLVGFHNPKAEFSDSSRCDYGIQVGRDQSRPHCILVYNFTSQTPCVEPKSDVWETVWTPELKDKYLSTCGDSIASNLPAFRDEKGLQVGSGDSDDEESNLELEAMPGSDAAPVRNESASGGGGQDMVVSPSKEPAAASRVETTSEPARINPASSSADIFREELSEQQGTAPSSLEKALESPDAAALMHSAVKEMEELNVHDDIDATWNQMITSPALEEVNDEATRSAIRNLAAGIDNDTAQTIAERIKERGRNKSKVKDRIMNLSIKQALRDPKLNSKVDASVYTELKQMPDKDVWDFITPAELADAWDRGEIKNIIPSSLFLKLKSDMETLKARLIVHGNHQILSDLFGSTASPTINFNVLLIVLSLAAKLNLDFEAADITGAYLNADLPEPEFMRLNSDIASILVKINPEYKKYVVLKNGTMVVRLKKALYGLKNSGILWYNTLNKVLLEAGFTRSQIDKCLYIRKEGDKVTYACIYVDDIMLAGNDQVFRSHVIACLETEFKGLTRQPLNDVSFLGLSIKKDADGDVIVDQHAMIDALLEEYGVVETSTTPCSSNIMNDHSTNANRIDPTMYRGLNMKLLYLATRTRPDILFPTVVYATRSDEPTDIDFGRLVKVLSYLKGTADKALVFKRAGPIYLHAYVDASFNLHWDAKGHNGFCLFVDKYGSACVIVKCGKQKSTADSSTESELMALHEAAKYICLLGTRI